MIEGINKYYSSKLLLYCVEMTKPINRPKNSIDLNSVFDKFNRSQKQNTQARNVVLAKTQSIEINEKKQKEMSAKIDKIIWIFLFFILLSILLLFLIHTIIYLRLKYCVEFTSDTDDDSTSGSSGMHLFWGLFSGTGKKKTTKPITKAKTQVKKSQVTKKPKNKNVKKGSKK